MIYFLVLLWTLRLAAAEDTTWDGHIDAAIPLGEKALGRDHPLIAEALEGKAKLLRKLKHKTEARQIEDRVRSMRRTSAFTNPARHTVDIKDLGRRQDGVR